MNGRILVMLWLAVAGLMLWQPPAAEGGQQLATFVVA